jgi:hypothetical protein
MESKGNKKYALSNSMFLRFRLMSLLYLLFLVLAITQVSNAWMSLNLWLSDELREEQSQIQTGSAALQKRLDAPEFLAIREGIIELREADVRSEGLVRRFLMEGDLGKSMQKELLEIFYLLPQNAQNSLRGHALSSDFENGFENLDQSEWRKWKFKNLTPGLVEILFEQMVLSLIDAADLALVEGSSTNERILRWPICRYVGDSLPLNWKGGLITWTQQSKNRGELDGNNTKWLILEDQHKGTWEYRILNDLEEIVGSGNIEVKNRPRYKEQKLEYTKAFWLPGDTLRIYNSNWKSVSIDNSKGRVIRSEEGLFWIRVDVPGITLIEVTDILGEKTTEELRVNNFPVPELRKTVAWNQRLAQSNCLELQLSEEYAGYSIQSVEGFFIGFEGRRALKSEQNCIDLSENNSKPDFIQCTRIVLNYRGYEVEVKNHTIKVI